MPFCSKSFLCGIDLKHLLNCWKWCSPHDFKFCTKLSKDVERNWKESINLNFDTVKETYRSLVLAITLSLFFLNFPSRCIIKWASNPLKLCNITGINSTCLNCRLHFLCAAPKNSPVIWSWFLTLPPFISNFNPHRWQFVALWNTSFVSGFYSMQQFHYSFFLLQ